LLIELFESSTYVFEHLCDCFLKLHSLAKSTIMWQLETTKLGRQNWFFDKASLEKTVCVYDKKFNPNSADLVYRNLQKDRTKQAMPEGLIAEEMKLFKAVNFYQSLQAESGHWPGDYGGPMFLLPGLIIAAYITDSPFLVEETKAMKRYMLNHQNDDGGWGLHLEGHSTMFGSALQYVAIRLLGESADEPHMIKAREWIKANGGVLGVPSWGKFYLSLLGVYEWEGCQSLFPEMWMLPKWLPFHPSRYWCHARMVYLGMAYCYANRIVAKSNEVIHSLREELYVQNYSSIDWRKGRTCCASTDLFFKPSRLLRILNGLTAMYEKLAFRSLRERTSDYLLSYIEAEDKQTNYIDIGPVNQVINSIAVWFAYGKNSIAFRKHRARWQDYLWVAEDGMKMQGYNGSQLWDATFAAQAILEGGMERYFSETIEKVYAFIDRSQIQDEVVNHEVFFRHSSVGGWPFSTIEHGWPITDCTAEGLKTSLLIHSMDLLEKNTINHERLERAVDLLLSFQNKNGGWASYELTRAPAWIEAFNPSEIFGNIMVDYSYTECTSACVQALLKWQKHYPEYRAAEVTRAIQRGVKFILSQQRNDGSWYGSWAVCFTYGTWFAVEALTQDNSISQQPHVKRALANAAAFLLDRQHRDGGWGEQFESCVQRKYIPSQQSQVVNTSWALLSLMAIGSGDTHDAIKRGMEVLYSRQAADGDYAQENISGVFNHSCMITYTSYRNVFPIWAMGRYLKWVKLTQHRVANA